MDTVIAIDGFQADSFRRPEKVFRWLTWELLFLQNSCSCVFSLCVCFRLPVFWTMYEHKHCTWWTFPHCVLRNKPNCWLCSIFLLYTILRNIVQKHKTNKLQENMLGNVGIDPLKCWNVVHQLSVTCYLGPSHEPQASTLHIFQAHVSLLYIFKFLALAFVMDVSLFWDVSQGMLDVSQGC